MTALFSAMGFRNEKKGKQDSLTYRPSCTAAQKQEAASLAGVGRRGVCCSAGSSPPL